MRLTRFPELAAAVLVLSPETHTIVATCDTDGRLSFAHCFDVNGAPVHRNPELAAAVNTLSAAEVRAAHERAESLDSARPLGIRLVPSRVYEAEVVGSIRLALDLFHSQDNAKAFVEQSLKTRQPDAPEEAWKTQTDGILKTGRGRLRGYVTTRTLLD